MVVLRAHVSQFAIIMLRLRMQRKRKLQPILFLFSMFASSTSHFSALSGQHFDAFSLSHSLVVSNVTYRVVYRRYVGKT